MGDEKRVWDDTWRVNHLVVSANHENEAIFGSGMTVVDAVMRGDKFKRVVAALDLAAAAPDMARILLELAEHGRTWGCGCGANLGGCVSCEAGLETKVGTRARPTIADGHAPSCALVETLRYAGVLP